MKPEKFEAPEPNDVTERVKKYVALEKLQDPKEVAKDLLSFHIERFQPKQR